MTDREKIIVKLAANWAKNSSTNNGVLWAAKILEDLAEGKENPDCPACEGSKVFRDCPCCFCDATGTVGGVIKVRESCGY